MTDQAPNLDELVEWVSVDGSVIEVVTRQRMRAETLRHRATYVGVIDSKDQIGVHKRADWKEVYPGWWDLAFGGVCGAGEDWLEAAKRELAEEAGIQGEPLEPLGDLTYEGAESRVVGRAYLVRTDNTIIFSDGEVVDSDRVALTSLDEWMTDRLVCSVSRNALVPLIKLGVNKR